MNDKIKTLVNKLNNKKKSVNNQTSDQEYRVERISQN